MSRMRIAALVLTATTLAACGCGSSQSNGPSLTKADLIARADSICRRVNTMRRSVVIRIGAFEQDYALLLPSLASYEHSALQKLEKLTPPASLAADWTQFLTYFRTLVNNTQKTGEYAKSDNLNGISSLNTPNNLASGQITEIATRDGLHDCVRL